MSSWIVPSLKRVIASGSEHAPLLVRIGWAPKAWTGPLGTEKGAEDTIVLPTAGLISECTFPNSGISDLLCSLRVILGYL